MEGNGRVASFAIRRSFRASQIAKSATTEFRASQIAKSATTDLKTSQIAKSPNWIEGQPNRRGQ